MNIREHFKVGQTAYVMKRDDIEEFAPITQEVRVTKVGRKYVTVDNAGHSKMYEEPANTLDAVKYLIEAHDDYSETMLFLSMDDAEEYWSIQNLILWVRLAVTNGKLNRCTSKQLLEIQRILTANTRKRLGLQNKNETNLVEIERMMKRLTKLRVEQHTMSDCYGQSPVDGDIERISKKLAALGVKWKFNDDDEAEIIEA